MGQPPPHAADAEWAVLEVLWEEGTASVRRLVEVLYPPGGPSEYATVHKLLERLEGKRFVRRGCVFVGNPLSLDRNGAGTQRATISETDIDRGNESA